jgi:chromosome segregation ATPase
MEYRAWLENEILAGLADMPASNNRAVPTSSIQRSHELFDTSNETHRDEGEHADDAGSRESGHTPALPDRSISRATQRSHESFDTSPETRRSMPPTSEAGTGTQGCEDRFQRMEQDLSELREEIQEMQVESQKLARQLNQMDQEIHDWVEETVETRLAAVERAVQAIRREQRPSGFQGGPVWR